MCANVYGCIYTHIHIYAHTYMHITFSLHLHEMVRSAVGSLVWQVAAAPACFCIFCHTYTHIRVYVLFATRNQLAHVCYFRKRLTGVSVMCM